MKIYKKNEVEKIINEINNNKIIIIPTDTQMGILCKNENKIYEIKKRDKNKKIIRFINSIENYNFSDNFKILANEFWPGKITLIESNISYRIPNNKLILKILENQKELFCSSANISGEKPFNNSIKYINKFDNKFYDDIVIVKGKTYWKKPSTIFDVTNNELIRIGKINKKRILKKINPNNF